MPKLSLDEAKVTRARSAAARISADIHSFIAAHTTTAVERTVARLFGIEGVDGDGVPLANLVVEDITRGGLLSRGAALALGNACALLAETPREVAEQLAAGRISLAKLPFRPDAARALADTYTDQALRRIASRRKEREQLLATLGEGERPYLYVIVATGNIYEDVTQARAAARAGADIVAVIRTTGQSLLDYVPYGATTEGFGGTYATQENFRIMRRALDEVGEELQRYIRLVNYASGLCMPEIAAMGALERLDMMLNDALYGILFRDINMQRTLIDQYFSRIINGYAGIIINTGEDNYLTTADAVEAAHTVLASQFINEQLAHLSGLPDEQIGLGHAFEIDPDKEGSMLLELAQAQMARQIFPRAPLKYMPPTKHMTGNIFRGHSMNALFNLTSVLTGQGIHLLGMLTEAIHTPFLQDRYLALENAKYVMGAARALADEITFVPGGKAEQRADEVLTKALALLERVEQIGLMEAIEQGIFADVKRSRFGGKGLDGVAKQAHDYYNPFVLPMLSKQYVSGGKQ
ncbi:MAG: L-beta-lysine 5,6-aminomutase alpha subunit [Firmicutes bacterium]|nr:L-beta-lysine 5,6-aminomutase alpha subunit [candidate division NPL-UPA2 bacterium]